MPAEIFERHDRSLQTVIEKREQCPSCRGMINPQTGECKCS